jgi:hypothetical protein
MNEMTLLLSEQQSALWQKILRHLEGRLVYLRSLNDGELSQTDTARLRGQIRELKNLIALGEGPNQSTEANED